jgi:large subunit ribosomal protein L10
VKIEQKKQIVEDLHERFVKSKIVIVTDYKGLDVKSITELRRKLGEENIELKVVKNTLLVRASSETEAELVQDHFKGPSAVALSYDDPVTPAKVLTQFAEKNERLKIKAGVMGGKLISQEQILALSKLPTREVLLGQLLSVMNNVPTAFVTVLSEIPRQMVNVLQAVKDQKEAA